MSDLPRSSLHHHDECDSRTGSKTSGLAHESIGERYPSNDRAIILRRGSNTTEDTFIQRPMGILDVASVILNKMVGTGIFTVPGQVLVSTGSKRISLVLWAVGGLWTAAWYSSEISQMDKEVTNDTSASLSTWNSAQDSRTTVES